MIWANLLHLSYNMWADRDAPEWGSEFIAARDYLRFDQELWEELLHKMSDIGMNMVIIDLGDGVKYKSHPEIAVRDAYSVKQLKDEIKRARDLGLEPIPKLNFSATHDAWLGSYSRCLSTDTYYEICSDLISEIIEIFDTPRFFHLGMDEETAEHQVHHEYVVIRQYDLWWHDLQFLVDRVEKSGVRPWIWSDYLWHHPDLFWERMPKSVLQSNWYYGSAFNKEIDNVRAYDDLEEHGYDQVPTGSNWGCPENFENMVRYCKKSIDPQRLLGFMQTPWKPTLPDCRDRHIQALEVAEKAIAEFDSM